MCVFDISDHFRSAQILNVHVKSKEDIFQTSFLSLNNIDRYETTDMKTLVNTFKLTYFTQVSKKSLGAGTLCTRLSITISNNTTSSFVLTRVRITQSGRCCMYNWQNVLFCGSNLNDSSMIQVKTLLLYSILYTLTSLQWVKWIGYSQQLYT